MSVELSILMPVYNERATVEQAIAAVLDAGLTDSLELLVVDDGSTDGTRELLNETSWPEQVNVLMHDRNRGKGAALRTAREAAQGEFCAVMDADPGVKAGVFTYEVHVSRSFPGDRLP